MLPVECIARGYLAGLGLETYQATGSVSGVDLPPGLVEADRLPTPGVHAVHQGGPGRA